MSVTMQRVAFEGWKDCLKISNGKMEVIVATEFGIRILGVNLVGKENLIYLVEDDKGRTNDKEYRFYGGHRIWHTPEDFGRTYSPDNVPVQVTEIENGFVLTQNVEPETFMQKEMELTMCPETAAITVKHRIYNRGVWPVTTSVWCITQLEKGGYQVMPIQKNEFQLTHTWNMSFWSYTEMNDHRMTFGKEYFYLQQDPAFTRTPLKVGYRSTRPWAAYSTKGQMLVKTYDFCDAGMYPDNNCSFESYINEHFIEMETLSPLTEILPGTCKEHVERWYLFDDVEVKPDDAYINEVIVPIVEKLK